MKDSSYEARQERRDRERQAGEAFQKVLRERVNGPGITLEDLMGRGERKPEGGDDVR